MRLRAGLSGQVMVFCAVLLVGGVPGRAQSTEVVITGKVVDAASGEAIPRARVRYRNYETGASGTAETDGNGAYSLPSLPPGIYNIRAEEQTHQARELQSRELFVAARLELNFALRPLSQVLESGNYPTALLPDDEAVLPVLGPDLQRGASAPLDATEAQSEVRQPSLSYVVDPRQIDRAPLSARNVYALLVTLPGATAAQVTGRGLQISTNGQRASASNYLLDGVQNNDFVNTGPFSATAPEAIEEYRVSTSNYSAEYGQTGGFIANAVTARGGNRLHGSGYTYLDNDALAANTFQNNANFLPRNPFKRFYGGYSVMGPVFRDRLFFSSAYERLRSRSLRNTDLVSYFLPERLRECAGASSSPILDLYERFPLQGVSQPYELSFGNACQTFEGGFIRRPVSLDRSLYLERMDYQSPGGAHRLMGRLAISRVRQPDFVYNIYQGLSQSISRETYGLAIGYVRTLGPSVTNDVRLGWSSARITSLRPHPEIPVIQIFANSEQSFSVPSAIPAAPDFGMKGWNGEITDGLSWTRGRHVVVAGGGVLLRRPEYLLSYLDQGLYNFGSFNFFTEWIQNFARGRATYYQIPVNLADAVQGKIVPVSPAGFDQYSDSQFSAYFQDSVRLTTRLVVNAGVRYESYGSLSNDSRAQTFVEPGQGGSIAERLASARLLSERRAAYHPDRNDWAGRLGISYAPRPTLVLRAGAGIFYDRPFDNLFLDARNDRVNGTFAFNRVVDFRENPATVLRGGASTPVSPLNVSYIPAAFGTYYQTQQVFQSRIAHSSPLELLWIDRNLRTPHIQSWFASAQQQLSSRVQLEVSHSGATGRKLLSNDLVNRSGSLPTAVALGRFNPALPDILYRSNAGASNYMSLSALGRYRAPHVFFQAAYTYSHSIDNLSDPLLSDIFNLAATNPDTIGEAHGFGTFTRQFDSASDRGSSDFDIRHGLTFYSIWDVPEIRWSRWLDRVASGWTLAETAGIRTGLPYTIFSPSARLTPGVPVLVGARTDVTDPGVLHNPRLWPGGKIMIDVKGLAVPAAGAIGSLGRNALKGPGFWNVDLSVSRSFSVAILGESSRLRIGASAFNAFNHSNLGFPDIYTSLALYGPTQNQSQFPAALPLFPTPRRIQLQAEVTF